MARWGGEEFVFLLPQTSLKEGTIAMEKVRNAIEQLHMIYQKSSYKITVTIGISTYNGRQKVRDLVKQADVNLYEGKQKGKNCVIAS